MPAPDTLIRGPSAIGPVRPDVPARIALLSFAVATVIVCLVIGAINLVVNPLEYYSTECVRPLAWNSRKQKAAMLRGVAPPGVLVLGSSRSMKLAPTQIERITGLRAFNAGVDSARVEDYYCMFRHAKDACRAPLKELIVAVDLDAFRNDLAPDARLLRTPALARYLPDEFRANQASLRLAAESLISWDQFRESLRSLKFASFGYPKPIYRFDEDGVLHYVEWERQMAAGTFRPDIEAAFDEYDARMEHFTGIDPRRAAAFEALLQSARDNAIRVRSFLTPFPAAVRAHLEQTRDFARLRKILCNYLIGLAARYSNFTFDDYTDVEAARGDPDGFLDGSHTTDANSKRILQALYERPQGASAALPYGRERR